MTRRLITTAAALALALGLTLPTDALAQSIDTRIDVMKDEVKADKARVKDAKKDLKKIKKIRKKWEQAREKDKASKEAKADVDLADWVRSEIDEDRVEASDAAGEVARGGGDPTPRDKRAKPPMHGPDPERPAVADDQRDLARERADLADTRAIARELRDMQPKFSNGTARAPAYKKKSALLEQLQRGAARDLARAEKELAEDEARLDTLKDKR